ncbi:MAG: c-type cytochrome [Opitutaceae bacterium]|nr:c-type cytochrome [Opitutaceae bacterium]
MLRLARAILASWSVGLAIVFAAEPAAPFGQTRPRADPPATPPTPEELRPLVVAPPEFEVGVFATADQANYPVSVAAAPDGTLYVASDANSSLGTDLGRGRIIRLRDTDGDGRADEVRPFAKVDSPRGLVWDVDRLYVMHPPHLSVFIDRDGDGIADEQKILVKDIAFSFRDRPADHSSNGVTLGVDGWLYLAIGDFGFMAAEGTDGRRLQLRGGGVVRVRPDGTGLELFARGTRNILEVALSPLLDGIARDNTNDGDGWDIRLHHFSGLEEHGYPALYKNFAAEAVAPLADYGGGSGCGALWLDEPGIPAKWNASPLTVDWGRERVYHHALTPRGATFAAAQEEFAKAPRATDLDVDAQSRIYLASWRGGQYGYAGPNIGFIARLTVRDYTPAPLPDFTRATGPDLVALFSSASHRTRLAAQRHLLRRGVANEVVALATLASDATRPLVSRVLALFTLKQALGEKSHPVLARLAADPAVAAWAIRALTDHEGHLATVPAAPLQAGLKSADARTRKEAAVAFARLGQPSFAAPVAALLGDADPVVAHTAVKALVRLRAADPAFAVIESSSESPARRTDALRVVQALHDEKVVDRLIALLARDTDDARRDGLIRTLCRLAFTDAPWTGDSWGTRPDTRGPYYQPARWAGSAKINNVLKELQDRAEGPAAAKLNEIFSLYRVSPGDSTARLMTLAATDDSLLPALAQQLAGADTVPPAAIPLLLKAIAYAPPAPPPPPPPAEGAPAPQKKKAFNRAPNTAPTQIAAMQALVRIGTAEAMRVVLDTLPTLRNAGRLGDGARDRSANALFQSPAMGNHYRLFGEAAAKLDGERSTWADAVLLHLSAQKFGSPEARAFATTAVDDGWKIPARRAQLVRAAALGRETSRASALVAALDDPVAEVAEAARATVAALKIDADAIRAESRQTSPLVGSIAPAEVLPLVVAQRGSVARGEQVFALAGCVACHTVNAADPLKGPFLGNAAKMFPRRELAEAILDPGKSIAQGFVTNQFTLKDGSTALGFVTRESAEVVSVRDIAGQQRDIRVADVAKRDHLPTSLMPPGLMLGLTVRDFASLLDYLESLSAGKN